MKTVKSSIHVWYEYRPGVEGPPYMKRQRTRTSTYEEGKQEGNKTNENVNVSKSEKGKLIILYPLLL